MRDQRETPAHRAIAHRADESSMGRSLACHRVSVERGRPPILGLFRQQAATFWL